MQKKIKFETFSLKFGRNLLIFILLFNCVSIQAQYREMFDKYPYRFLQQTDRLYKANRVKSRVTFSKGFSSLTILHEFKMDNQGRITEIMYQPFMSVQTRRTRFTYTD